jgi:hypothetical protein
MTKPKVVTNSRKKDCLVLDHSHYDCVGTLKLGYPLLLCKDAVLMRLSLSHVVKVLCVGPGHDSS